MNQIIKREMRDLSHSLPAWVFTALFLFLSGLVFTATNWLGATNNLSVVYGDLMLFSLLFVPLLAAKSVCPQLHSEQQRVLRSLPIPFSSVLLGKYFALLLWILFPTAITALFPVILSNYGTAPYANSYLQLLGLVFTAAAFLAFSMLIASRIKRWWLAWIIASLSGVLMYFAPLIATLCSISPWILFSVIVAGALGFGLFLLLEKKRKRSAILLMSIVCGISLISIFLFPRLFDHVLPDLIDFIAIPGGFDGFRAGYFPIGSVVWLLSVLIVCLFFTVRIFKFSKERNALSALLLLGILLVTNFIPAFLPYRVRNLGSTNQAFIISEEGIASRKGIGEDVTILYLSSGGERNVDPDLFRFALSFADASPKIRVKVIDTATDRNFRKSYRNLSFTDQSMLVTCGERYCLVDNTQLYYYINLAFQAIFTPDEYTYYVELFKNTPGEEAALYLDYLQSYTVSCFCGEAVLNDAVIQAVSGEAPSAEETALPRDTDRMMTSDTLDKTPSGWFLPLLCILLLPGAALTTGAIIQYSRKKK